MVPKVNHISASLTVRSNFRRVFQDTCGSGGFGVQKQVLSASGVPDSKFYYPVLLSGRRQIVKARGRAGAGYSAG